MRLGPFSSHHRQLLNYLRTAIDLHNAIVAYYHPFVFLVGPGDEATIAAEAVRNVQGLVMHGE
jgi:hypothetical protein